MDIADWLRSLGLEQYEAGFRDNAIDEAVLPRLTCDDLKEIGVTQVGNRRQLLDAIAAMECGDLLAYPGHCSVKRNSMRRFLA